MGILLSYDEQNPVEPSKAVECEVWDARKTGSILDSPSGTVQEYLTKDLEDAINCREKTWRGWVIHYPKAS